MTKKYTKPFASSLVLIVLLSLANGATAKQAKQFNIPANGSCITSTCHNSMATKKYVHAVAADGSMCTFCHQQASKIAHNFKLVKEGGELCGQCHSNMLSKEHKHAPAAAGACTFCHSPHQSDYPKQLNFPPTGELCFNCHDNSHFKGSLVHGPVKDGKCTACHDPHSADHAKQLKISAPELCLSCHDKRVTDHEGKILPAIKPLLDRENVNKHAPVAMGGCVLCHSPHSSNNFRLLTAPYPKSFYASFSADKYICFNCHADSAFAKIETNNETNFRNGSLNLHYRHVNRQKGRTCRACHHHHGAENEALIRSNVAFGSRDIFITHYKKTDTGGSCSPTCHTTVKYDRVKPVLNSLKVSPRTKETVSGALKGKR